MNSSFPRLLTLLRKERGILHLALVEPYGLSCYLFHSADSLNMFLLIHN